MKKKEVDFLLPSTKKRTLEEIARVSNQIFDLEFIQKKKKQESLWSYKRQLIAHLENL